MNFKSMLLLASVSVAAVSLSACSPVGLAIGAGATAGVASQQEGGIRGAADDVRIKAMIGDKWITTRLRTQLTFEKNVSAINYSIDTVQGTIYLMGVARNQAELDHVIGIARGIPNVKEVVSYVKPLGEAVQGQAVWATPQAQSSASLTAPDASSTASGAPASLSTPIERTPLSP